MIDSLNVLRQRHLLRYASLRIVHIKFIVYI
jgi:hypothetical protein